MIWLILLILTAIASLSVLFFGNLHGYPGAVILGLNGVFFDVVWQWLRFKVVSKGKVSLIAGGILGGLAIRVISVFIFIKISQWWLGKSSPYFLAFAVCLLTIPLWSLLIAYKARLRV